MSMILFLLLAILPQADTPKPTPRFVISQDNYLIDEPIPIVISAIELAENHGIPRRELTRIEEAIRSHERQIRTAWQRHFGR